jgi:hypothetical protein
MGAGIDADLRLHVHYSIPFPVTFRFACEGNKKFYCLYVDHITVKKIYTLAIKIIFDKFPRNIDLEGSRVNCGIMAH